MERRAGESLSAAIATLKMVELEATSGLIRKPVVTIGTVCRPDRILAAQLFQRGVVINVIEDALLPGGHGRSRA